jgi:hypothetical protein
MHPKPDNNSLYMCDCCVLPVRSWQLLLAGRYEQLPRAATAIAQLSFKAVHLHNMITHVGCDTHVERAADPRATPEARAICVEYVQELFRSGRSDTLVISDDDDEDDDPRNLPPPQRDVWRKGYGLSFNLAAVTIKQPTATTFVGQISSAINTAL